MTKTFKALVDVVTVPWNAFVAAFLYYSLLAGIALSGFSPNFAVVGTAYLAPVVAYLVVVAFRLAGAVGHGVGAVRLRLARS